MVIQLGHVLAMLALGWLVFAGCRWIRRRSEAIGLIVAFGVLVRVTLGLALFSISYLELPIARSLQTAGGFWQVAADAQGYYEIAARGIDTGRLVQDWSAPSPFYGTLLTLWMLVVGTSPAAGMFLNLCLYLALVAAVVWCFDPVDDWRLDLPCLAGIGAYSFSPVILIHGTQPLKDDLSNTLVAAACLSVLGLRWLIYGPSTARRRVAVATGAIALIAATFGAAGIRWYAAVIIWAALAALLAMFSVRGRRTPLLPYLVGSVSLLVGVWVAFWAGAGPYYLVGPDLSPRRLASLSAGSVWRRIVEAPSSLGFIELTRVGFLMSGGGTNIAVPLREDPNAGQARIAQLVREQQGTAAYAQRLAAAEAAQVSATPRAAAEAAQASATPRAAPSPLSAEDVLALRARQAEAARAIPVNVPDQVSVIGTGLAILFIPISLLKASSVLDIAGGRGLLSVADLDTVFQDATILFIFVLLWKRRDAIGDRLPFVVFGLTLSCITAFLLGYVVTNFGTLWRMRPLVAVPIWLLVVALSPAAARRRAPTMPSSSPP